MPLAERSTTAEFIPGELISKVEHVLGGQLVLHAFKGRLKREDSSQHTLSGQNDLPVGLRVVSNSFKKDVESTDTYDVKKTIQARNAESVSTRSNQPATSSSGEKLTFLDSIKRIYQNKKKSGIESAETLLLDADLLFNDDESDKFYALGVHFFKKYKSGLKHFLFSHISAHYAQKKSILGVAAFSSFFESLKVGIVTSNMDDSAYSEIKKNGGRSFKSLGGHPNTLTVDVVEHKGIDFIEMEVLSAALRQRGVRGKEVCLRELLKEYDIVLYDISTLERGKLGQEIHFSIFRLIEDVTVTVVLNKNTFSEVENVRRYFRQHSMELNGCIIENKLQDSRGYHDS